MLKHGASDTYYYLCRSIIIIIMCKKIEGMGMIITLAGTQKYS